MSRFTSRVALAASLAVSAALLASAPAGLGGTASATTTRAPMHVGMAFGERLTGLSSSQLASALNDAQALGITWVRSDLDWAATQPTSPSSFNWTNFDRVVAAATSRKMSVLPIIDWTPTWARVPGCPNSHCAPADPNQYAAFAAAAVRHYAPLGIHTWELWNEPNMAGSWLPAANAQAYAAMVKLAVAAMRAADPTAYIVSGGLSPAATTPYGNIAQRDFLTAFCQYGGAAAVDAIGYHPYSFPVPPGYAADWNAWWQMNNTTVSFRSILASYGQGSKQIWVTEYGAPTNGPGAAATPTNYFVSGADHVTEQLQAQMATQSMQLASTQSWVGAFFWDTNVDLSNQPTTPEWFFGLRRYDGTAKPAYTSLKQAIAVAKAAGLAR